MDDDQDALWVRTAGNTMIDNIHLNVGVDTVRLLGCGSSSSSVAGSNRVTSETSSEF